MTKFIVGYEEDNLIITNTLADAEEYLLSEIEEAAYIDFLYAINYCGDSMEDYIETLRDGWRSKRFATLYGLALDYNGNGYWYSECHCLD